MHVMIIWISKMVLTCRRNACNDNLHLKNGLHIFWQAPFNWMEFATLRAPKLQAAMVSPLVSPAYRVALVCGHLLHTSIFSCHCLRFSCLHIGCVPAAEQSTRLWMHGAWVAIRSAIRLWMHCASMAIRIPKIQKCSLAVSLVNTAIKDKLSEVLNS